MTLSLAIALAAILPSVVALAVVLSSAMAMVIAIVMTVAMATYIALAEAIAIVRVIHNQKVINILGFYWPWTCIWLQTDLPSANSPTMHSRLVLKDKKKTQGNIQKHNKKNLLRKK